MLHAPPPSFARLAQGESLVYQRTDDVHRMHDARVRHRLNVPSQRGAAAAKAGLLLDDYAQKKSCMQEKRCKWRMRQQEGGEARLYAVAAAAAQSIVSANNASHHPQLPCGGGGGRRAASA